MRQQNRRTSATPSTSANSLIEKWKKKPLLTRANVIDDLRKVIREERSKLLSASVNPEDRCCIDNIDRVLNNVEQKIFGSEKKEVE